MLGVLRVYFNTGFGGGNIPYDVNVLNTAQYKTFEGVYYSREDLEKPYFDIKASYSDLANADYLSYTVATDYQNGQNVTVNKTSYYFCSPKSLARGVTRLYCELDALLTMGGVGNLDYSGGWQERGHIKKEEDILFSNIASEDWLPTMPLIVSNSGKFGHKDPDKELNVGDLDVVISSIDLYTLGSTSEYTQEVIEGIPVGETDPVMYFPAIPVVNIGTEYKTYDYTDLGAYVSFSIPASAAFQYKDTDKIIQTGMRKLFSTGQLELQASYSVPGQYLDQNTNVGANPTYVSGKPGQIESIRGVHSTIEASNFKYEYEIDGYTIKNKKCFTTYRQFVLSNLGSSDTSIKTPEEIYDPTSDIDHVQLFVWSDPSSTGKPYARFKYIRNNPVQYSDSVKGLQWNNNQIMMQGASGSLWNSIDAAFSRSSIERQQEQTNLNASYAARNSAVGLQRELLTAQQQQLNNQLGYVGTVGRALTNGLSSADPMIGVMAAGEMTLMQAPLTMIQNRQIDDQLALSSQQAYNSFLQEQANADINLAQLRQDINENQIGLLRNNNIVAPTLLFTPEQNLGLYGYNYFVLYEVRKTNADLKSEDEYYQRFGYNGLHRPLTKECFNTRQYYTYVQAFNVNIKSDYGLRIRQKAIAQLNSGVRVWKVLPDASYYELN